MPVDRSAWIEWRRFSAALLALVGALNVAEGFIVLNDEAFGADRSRVAFGHPLGWARLTLLLGVLMLAVALWLAAVTTRVRSLAVPVVALHALIQLGVLAAYPVWALLMIAFDVVILFALTAPPAGGAASSVPAVGKQYRPRHRLTGEPTPLAVPVAVPPSRTLPTGGAPIVGAISGRFPDATVGA
jgi:hypothetical protein